jgi:hypothetical protein
VWQCRVVKVWEEPILPIWRTTPASYKSYFVGDAGRFAFAENGRGVEMVRSEQVGDVVVEVSVWIEKRIPKKLL